MIEGGFQMIDGHKIGEPVMLQEIIKRLEDIRLTLKGTNTAEAILLCNEINSQLHMILQRDFYNSDIVFKTVEKLAAECETLGKILKGGKGETDQDCDNA